MGQETGGKRGPQKREAEEQVRRKPVQFSVSPTFSCIYPGVTLTTEGHRVLTKARQVWLEAKP